MAKLVFGSFVFTTPVETPLAAATPAKALGTTAAGPLADFTMPQNNRLLYTGLTTRAFQINMAIAAQKTTGGATNAIFHVHINDLSPLPDITIERTIANNNDTGAIPICGAFNLSTGDYVELWLETANGDNITIIGGQMVISVLG